VIKIHLLNTMSSKNSSINFYRSGIMGSNYKIYLSRPWFVGTPSHFKEVQGHTFRYVSKSIDQGNLIEIGWVP